MNNLIRLRYLIPLAMFLGLAPFYPEPHIVEKARMLARGTLSRPIDILDLAWHAWPLAFLLYRTTLYSNVKV